MTEVITARINEAQQAQLAELRACVHAPFEDRVVMDALFGLAQRLHPVMTEYSTIVGDDVGGRLPALLYGRLINQVRAESHAPSAQLYFLNGKYRGDLLDTEFPKAKSNPGRTLIMTEYVRSGRSVINLYQKVSARQPRDHIDIAAVGMRSGYTSEIIKSHMHPASRYFMVRGTQAVEDHLYGSKVVQQSGVRKVYEGLYTRRQPEGVYAEAVVRQARNDIAYIAGTFYEMLPSRQ
jgi:hypothetical protein